MIEKLVDQIEARFKDLSDQMSDPEVINDRERYAQVGREYSALEPAHQLAVEYRRAADDAAGARELLDDAEDAEMREMLQTSEARMAELEEEIRLSMVERDPNDDKNVIVEVRGGAGGEEAGLFAGDIYRMLLRYAERRGFKTETLSESDGDYTSRSAAATAPTASSSSRAARTACSASRRPSRRAASTPRPRPWQSCRRPRRSTSRSTRTTSR